MVHLIIKIEREGMVRVIAAAAAAAAAAVALGWCDEWWDEWSWVMMCVTTKMMVPDNNYGGSMVVITMTVMTMNVDDNDYDVQRFIKPIALGNED